MLKIIKALSHQNRLRILNLIRQQDLCVCELRYIMQSNQSNVSRHLSKLKTADIVTGEHQAQWIYYQLKDSTLQEYPFLELIIEDELKKLDICQQDNERLADYQANDLSCKNLSK